ncbi:MAG: indolepyruvate ferredoxin oxidoreductase family protein [Burkholderiales bacterium]
MTARPISLDDKYTLDSGRVFLTGIQALVRLPMIQRQRDLAAGLNTAGFISGYRGSPIGGLDQNLWKAKKHLDQHHIVFVPGVNEELAADAVWGSQQVNLYPEAKYDGVFGMWYGKGPGVDRCGDVFKHGNATGSSKHGGVLLVAGDDHAAKSSTLPHQSDHAFDAAMIPVLSPAGVQEFIDFGIHGWAMSRYSGCWVGFKTISDTAESSTSVDIDPFRVKIVIPTDFNMPEGGLNIRWPDPPLEQEKRIQSEKIYAALAYARANYLNKIIIDSPKPKLGIIASGKAYLDVRQALDDLGIDEKHAAELGLRVYKIGMTWPLEPEGIHKFAEGLEEILVVEEKRQVLEYQLKEQLYNWREDVRPRVVGKYDEKGEWVLPQGHGLLPAAGELTPAMIARVIAARIARFHTSDIIQKRLAFLDEKEKTLAKPRKLIQRTPYFCSGCPHNTSTVVPAGSRATAGIGCHYMAIWMDRETSTFTQMGGEGAPWIGQAPFTNTPHIFANLGDGTYYHSGSLAIRAAVAAGVNITYKILYNDAVAMTGGQPVDGPISVPIITQQLKAEGVNNIVVMSDDVEKYSSYVGMAPGLRYEHRDHIDAVQRELREQKGVSVLLYDQTCAAEKRRRRKRGKFPDPAKRAFINEAVCEGCGDCSVKSNCLSVEPVETEFGRKRVINQSSCNKDYSCVNGFCPSFVTIEGGGLKKRKATQSRNEELTDLPLPRIPAITHPYSVLITGVGGTGVVTIGALLGMAAHIEGKGVTVLDMTGLAQKGGAVFSHVRIANRPEDLHAVRVAAGEANLVLGCDLVVAACDEAIAKMQTGVTRAVINHSMTPTAEFTHNPDLQFPVADMVATIQEEVSAENADFIDAAGLATGLMGDAIATNLFMMGYAFQKALLPLQLESIMQAIELNAVSVDMNKQSFTWGRRAAHDLQAVTDIAEPKAELPESQVMAENLGETIARRVKYLTAYQDAAYAARYTDLVDKVAAAEKQVSGKQTLTEAVAKYYFKLLAIKDEYEVARLYTDGEFLKRVKQTFDGDYKIRFHLAPPLIAKADPVTGEMKKSEFGPWMLNVFKLLNRLKFLRGTALDIFSYSAERKMEKQLLADYEKNIAEILSGLNRHNYATAVEIAALPEHIRGFGHVKQRHVKQVQLTEHNLLKAFRSPVIPIREAA